MSDRYRVVLCRGWTGTKPKLSLLKAIRQWLDDQDDKLLCKTPDLERLRGLLHTQQAGDKRPPAPEGERADKLLDAEHLDQLAARVTLKDVFECMKPNRCILVLDQFEEIFQNQVWDESFYNELSAVINCESLEVRVVFSMREEFLGELSVFDNRIPDLFYNYYRLKHPNREQGLNIIERICQQAGTEVDATRLPLLLADLSRVRRGLSPAGASDTDIPDEIETATVMLPYMQLVCQRLWKEWARSEEPFLTNYEKGKAIKVLEKFCEEKLRSLNYIEQVLLSQALGYLIWEHGAKMPCELQSLSASLGRDAIELGAVLGKLSAPDTRILKESHPGDGTRWFELYHDMYAAFLYRWKDLRRKEEEEGLTMRPIEIIEWEERMEPLPEFWVYLPAFLGGADKRIADKIIDTMAHNFVKKNTRYLYIVEAAKDVSRLSKLVKRLKRHPICRDNDVAVAAMVSVLVLSGTGSNSIAQAVSGLLHLGNCWIANPRSSKPEGYEVAWDRQGKKVEGGRILPSPKISRVVENLTKIIGSFQPPTFEGVESEADLERLMARSPKIRVDPPSGD